MIGVLIVVHVIICAFLIMIILVQAGRGGGLIETFSGVETMFGPKTSAFLTKATSTFAVLFFFTCVSLAVLSARQNKSLLIDTQEIQQKQGPQTQAPKIDTQTAPAVQETPKQELPKQETPAQNTTTQEAPKNK